MHSTIYIFRFLPGFSLYLYFLDFKDFLCILQNFLYFFRFFTGFSQYFFGFYRIFLLLPSYWTIYRTIYWTTVNGPVKDNNRWKNDGGEGESDKYPRRTLLGWPGLFWIFGGVLDNIWISWFHFFLILNNEHLRESFQQTLRTKRRIPGTYALFTPSSCHLKHH